MSPVTRIQGHNGYHWKQSKASPGQVCA